MQEKIKLVSTAETGHFYTTAKNKRTHPAGPGREIKKARLERVFFLPRARAPAPGGAQTRDSGIRGKRVAADGCSEILERGDTGGFRATAPFL